MVGSVPFVMIQGTDIEVCDGVGIPVASCSWTGVDVAIAAWVAAAGGLAGVLCGLPIGFQIFTGFSKCYGILPPSLPRAIFVIVSLVGPLSLVVCFYHRKI